MILWSLKWLWRNQRQFLKYMVIHKWLNRHKLWTIFPFHLTLGSMEYRMYSCFQPTMNPNYKKHNSHNQYCCWPIHTWDLLQICTLRSKDNSLLNIMCKQYRYIPNNLKMNNRTSYKGYSKTVDSLSHIHCKLKQISNLNRTELRKWDIDLHLKKEGTQSYIADRLHFAGNWRSCSYTVYI